MAVQFQSARSHDGLSRLARGLILLLLVGWLNVPCANAMDPVPTPKPGPGPTDPVPHPPDPKPEPATHGSFAVATPVALRPTSAHTSNRGNREYPAAHPERAGEFCVLPFS